MKHLSLFSILALLQTMNAAELQPQPDRVSLKNEIQIAIDKGLAWLQKSQNADGSWSLPEYPAQTALPLTAFMLEPSGRWRKEKPEFVQKGYSALTKATHPDGGIYGKGLANYNTSISLAALVAAEEPKFNPTIQAAKNFVIGQQARNMINPALDGGIGYGPVGTDSGNPDLSNTVMALEALHASQLNQKAEIATGKDLNWPAVISFIQRCQNSPESNSASWVSTDPKDKGGFIYAPGKSKSETTDPTTGKVTPHSYGSMSYAGLLSYIYADVKKDDPRVLAVIDWLTHHYTLNENPGMGADGLYYYYYMMSKALFAYGAPDLKTPDGAVDWRKEIALKLINLQKSDGSWSNESGRWMEKDPTLVTSYSVLALEFIHHAF